MTNPFTPRQQPQGWVVPVSLMMLIVGFMASQAFGDTERRRAVENRLGELDRAGIKPDLTLDKVQLAERVDALEGEIKKLNRQNDELQKALSKEGTSNKETIKILQDMKRVAGLTPLQGPGIQVTLSDSKKMETLIDADAAIIHDNDLLKVINELWNAGAEAISIDDRRVGPRSNIRCVGSTVLVDEQKIATPIVIRAIGSAKNLYGALNLPGGVAHELRSTDPNMIRVEQMKLMRVPAWTGSTTWKVAQPVEESDLP